MTPRIPISELKLINSLYKAKFTQKEIKLKVDSVRQDEGRYTGKGVSTNTISQLSPASKHREKRTTAVYEHHAKYGIIQKIMRCMKCSERDAKTIYKRNIIPLCVGRFHDVNNANMVSIRYYALACNSKLYYIYTTPDYAETFNLSPKEHENDVWTYRSSNEYKEILSGSIGYDEIMEELMLEADGNYSPQLINVCILKA